MTERYRVATESELREEGRKVVSTPEGPIGVFWVDGELYAISGVCKHEYGPVCEGKVGRELTAEFTAPGDRAQEQFSSTPVIACPWHGWEYELETGEHVGDSDIALETYDVVIEDSVVYIEW